MGLGYNWVYHILLISIFKVCDLLIGKRSDTLVMLWVIFFWERHLGNRVPSMRLLNAMPISVIPYLPLASGSIGLFSQQAFTLDQESKDILKECSTLVVTICQVLNFKCSPPPPDCWILFHRKNIISSFTQVLALGCESRLVVSDHLGIFIYLYIYVYNRYMYIYIR